MRYHHIRRISRGPDDEPTVQVPLPPRTKTRPLGSRNSKVDVVVGPIVKKETP